MSRHRTAVASTLESLHHFLVPFFTVEVLESVIAENVDEVVLSLLPSPKGSVEVAPVHAANQELRTKIAQAGLSDVREVDVRVSFLHSEAVASCTTADGSVRRRRFAVVTVVGRSRIRTRWIHMWHDWQHEFRWPTESRDSPAA